MPWTGSVPAKSNVAAAIPAAFVAGVLPMIVRVMLLYTPRLHGAGLPAAAVASGTMGHFLAGARGRGAGAAGHRAGQGENGDTMREAGAPDPEPGTTVRRQAGNRRPFKKDVARPGSKRPADQADERRFPGTVRTDHAENFSRLQ